MDDAELAAARAGQQPAAARGWPIGRLFGIEVRLDPSVLIIFALVVSALGGGVFPSWHPDWPAALTWGLGLGAGLIFFASLLAHEFAHALMARHHGIAVPRITLFLFGGVSEMAAEPESPVAELQIAIVGPLMSLFLGMTFGMGAALVAGAGFGDQFAADPEAALATLGPLATLLFWLGPINLLLALFNMVPGFPLDGGRVLRALLWWRTGDLQQATRWASNAGRMVGWALMLLGLAEALGGDLLQGLWLVLIGWFLVGAATSSYSQMHLQGQLEGVTVRDLMRGHYESVAPNMALTRFVEDHLTQSSQVLWPVLEQDQLVGFVTLEQLKPFTMAQRDRLSVRDVMRTDLDQLTLPPATGAMDALRRLALADTPLAVVEHGRVQGLLAAADLTRWLALQSGNATVGRSARN